jgi:hypothetical protein
MVSSPIIIYSLIIVISLSLISNRISNTIEKIWNKFSGILGVIFPNILLTIVFFLLLTPLALLAKIFKEKSDYLTENKEGSIFINANKLYTKESFEKAY